jgi:GT2 family glycosyltransferase
MLFPTISLAIPTYNREAILLESIREALRFRSELLELLVIDQTRVHDHEVSSTLNGWHAEGLIRLVKLESPSLPGARNLALELTRADVLIFIDDDVLIDDGFVLGHRSAYLEVDVAAVAGRVRPPQDSAPMPRPRRTVKLLDYRHFDFDSETPLTDVGNFWGCNHSVRVSVARELGGYDEGYTGNALREETDLALNLITNGHRIVYAPAASLVHLASPSGGCRATDYSKLLGGSLLYFALKHRRTLGWLVLWDFWRAARGSFLNKVVPLRWLPHQFFLFLHFLATRRPKP